MLVPFSLWHAKDWTDVNAQHRMPRRNAPHIIPTISPTGHPTLIIPSNAIELMRQTRVDRFWELR